MTDKFELYDILSTIVPGALLLCWIPICFPSLLTVHSPKYTDAFAAVALTALAVLIGQLMLALSSLLEPFLYRTWGGRPSDRALKDGIKDYFPKDSAARIRKKLVEEAGEKASDRSLFLYAMQISDGAGIGRSPRFNGLYAYHRSLVTLMLLVVVLFAASALFGAFRSWSGWEVGGGLAVQGAVMLLAWHRAKQRGIYYVREVLLTAERVVDTRSVSTDNERP